MRNSVLCALMIGCVALLVSGCGKKVEAQRVSRQRYFLTALLLDGKDAGTGLKLTDPKVVAYNGIGCVDIGGIVGDEEAAKQDRVLNYLSLSAGSYESLSAYDQSLVAMIQPQGFLQGYAEADYTKDGTEAFGVKYYLEDFPVNYLPGQKAEEVVLNNDDDELKDVPQSGAETGTIDVTMSEIAGKKVYVVMADGIRAEVSAESGSEAEAEACAKKVAERLNKLIAHFNEVMRVAGNGFGNSDPGKVGLTGFWGHLDRHLDLDKLEYQPVRIKF